MYTCAKPEKPCRNKAWAADAKKRRKMGNPFRKESGRSAWRPVENAKKRKKNFLNNMFIYFTFKIVANRFGKTVTELVLTWYLKLSRKSRWLQLSCKKRFWLPENSMKFLLFCRSSRIFSSLSKEEIPGISWYATGEAAYNVIKYFLWVWKLWLDCNSIWLAHWNRIDWTKWQVLRNKRFHPTVIEEVKIKSWPYQKF